MYPGLPTPSHYFLHWVRKSDHAPPNLSVAYSYLQVFGVLWPWSLSLLNLVTILLPDPDFVFESLASAWTYWLLGPESLQCSGSYWKRQPWAAGLEPCFLLHLLDFYSLPSWPHRIFFLIKICCFSKLLHIATCIYKTQIHFQTQPPRT